MAKSKDSKESKESKEPKATDEANKAQFAIQRFFVKDLSFEAPGTPAVFAKEWKPEMHLDINTTSNKIKDDDHEVVLSLTVTVKSHDETAFLVEVKQAGIFSIKGFAEEQLHHTLGSFCPATLYPYAREVVTDIVSKGGFPQLILAPVNFEALYEQHKKQQGDKKAASQ